MRLVTRLLGIAAIALLTIPMPPAHPAAAAGPVKLNGPLASGYSVEASHLKPSADDTRALFLGDLSTSGITELYSTPINGGAQVKLNGPLVPNGRVQNFETSVAGNRVVYRADQEVAGRFDLYSVPADGSAAPTRLTNVPPGSQGAYTFRVSDDGQNVVFLQQRPPVGSPAEVVSDLYRVPVTGAAVPNKINPDYANFAGVDSDFLIADLGATDRVVWRSDQNTNGISQLYSAEYDGSDFEDLSGPLVAGGEVTSFKMNASSTRVVFRADKHIDETFELFSVPAVGGGNVKLNPALVAGQDVQLDYKITDGGGPRVVYRSDHGATGRFELYSDPIAGGATVLLNPALAANRDVLSFDVSSTMVAYIADQDTNDLQEVYSVSTLGGAVTKLNAAIAVGGDVFNVQIAPGAVYAVYRGDLDTDTVPELFARKLDASDPQRRVSPEINSGQVLTNYAFTNTGRAVFVIERQNREIYSNTLDGSVAVKINDTLVPGGTMQTSFAITPTSARVLYVAQQTSASFQAWARPASAFSPGILLSTGTAIGGDVESYRYSADGHWVVYLAAQDQYDVYELYSRRVDGSGSPIKINVPLLNADTDIVDFDISPTENRVVYMMSNSQGGIRVISAPIDGSDTGIVLNPPLGSSTYTSYCCGFSPDGTRVSFLVSTESSADLYTVPVAGGPAAKINGPLVPGGRVNSIIGFTPDSTRIVYAGDVDIVTQYELFSAPADGSAAAVKLNGPMAAGGDIISDAVVTPDGQHVVYRADQDTNDIVELYRVPIAGGAAVKISGPIAAGGSVNSLQLTPNGATVTYLARLGAGQRNQLYATPLVGGAIFTLNAPLIPLGDVLNWKISPDSLRVVYRADAMVDEVRELFSVPVDGSAPAVKLHPALAANQSTGDFAISPDSQLVVFGSNLDAVATSELYRVPIGGGALVKLNAPLVAGGAVEEFAIDPNGRRVLYTAVQETDGQYELYAAPLAGIPVFSGVVKVSGSLVPGGDVNGFRINPKNSYVVYNADQDAQNVNELYSSDSARVFDVTAPVLSLQVPTGW